MTDTKLETIRMFRDLIEANADGGDPSSDNEIMDFRVSELNIDSLDRMELIMNIENAFDVLLNEDDVLKCDRVSDIVDLVKRTV